MLRLIIAYLAGFITLGAFLPYARDILRGKVLPARSTRLMFALLLTVTLFQQQALGATLSLAVTIGEMLGAFLLLALSLRRGNGGIRRLDLICYGLLLADMIIWLSSGNALLGLYLSVLADVIAFFPTVRKTWLEPNSETALFYIIGAAAPLFNLLAVRHLSFQIALYPAALSIENAIEVALIYRRPPQRLY